MLVQLPKLIDNYIKAANSYDTDSALKCFSDHAAVLDEGETLIGKKSIREWIEKTKKKYRPQFNPLSIKENDDETVMTTEVSGTFDGSPIKLAYHFKIKNRKRFSATTPLRAI